MVNESDDDASSEELLKLGINPAWFADVRAAAALAKKDYETAVQHMIEGGFYNQAHNVSLFFANESFEKNLDNFQPTRIEMDCRGPGWRFASADSAARSARNCEND